MPLWRCWWLGINEMDADVDVEQNHGSNPQGPASMADQGSSIGSKNTPLLKCWTPN